MKHKLTVSIPTYNRAWILDEALWTICPQTERYFPETSCHVVNNASTDQTMDVLHEHAKRWRSLNFVSNPENIGLQGNIARAVEVPDAEWIWWMGDDDVMMPWGVSNVLDAIRTNGSGKWTTPPCFIGLNAVHLSPDSRKILGGVHPGTRIDEFYPDGMRILDTWAYHNVAHLSRIVVKRNLWRSARFWETLRPTDLYAFVRVLLEMASENPTAYLASPCLAARSKASTNYYHSKIAVAYLSEFPEFYRLYHQSVSGPSAGFRSNEKYVRRQRLKFALKIALFRDEYRKHVHLIRDPLVCHWLEKINIKAVELILRSEFIRNKVKQLLPKRVTEKMTSALDVDKVV
jgi:glycosyltransferase involved in cell wall biosynthesis